MSYAIAERFRGFLPVVVDVETAGFSPTTHALLEIAAIPISCDAEGQLIPLQALHEHIEPFEGSQIDESAMAFNKIRLESALRIALPETLALKWLYKKIKQLVKAENCQRAVLVGHNPAFDLSFLQAANLRSRITQSPFHRFTTFDTATLAGAAFGQTVLAKACEAAHISFDPKAAHSALYDAQKTAELFCQIINTCFPLTIQHILTTGQ